MQPPFTLSFDAFWSWLTAHPNCIVRAGTPEAVLYDDEDLHWTFFTYEGNTLAVQLLRGKRLAGELVIEADHVTYVQGVLGEIEGEHVFELIAEGASDRVVSFFFVMIHGFEDEEPSFGPGRVH